ncbi:MAG: glycosyltransferase [Candidatus Babeliales bacterium]
MKKKIVHVISSLKRGGAESLLIDLINALPHYEHVVIYFHDGFNRKRLDSMGIRSYRVAGLISNFDPLFCLRFYRLLFTLKPDVIHASLWAANFLTRIYAALFRVPCVQVIHLGVNCDGAVRNMLDKISFFMAQEVVAVSDGVYQSLAEKKFFGARQVQVISNGVNCAHIRAEAQRAAITRAQLAIDESYFVIGSVGRLIPRKNYQFLLHVFAALIKKNPKMHLVIVGFGPEECALKLLADRLGIAEAVSFVGEQTAFGYFPLFDCFVLPSLQEGMSIALLEAFCFALPCVITHEDNAHEVIVSGLNGILVSAQQEQLCNALQMLIDDPLLRNALGVQAYKTVIEQFSIERMARSYDALFSKKLGDQGPRAMPVRH